MDRQYMIADSVESFISGLESFRDEWERLANTDEQRRLSREFADFVAIVSPTSVAKAIAPAVERAREVRKTPEIDIDMD